MIVTRLLTRATLLDPILDVLKSPTYAAANFDRLRDLPRAPHPPDGPGGHLQHFRELPGCNERRLNDTSLQTLLARHISHLRSAKKQTFLRRPALPKPVRHRSLTMLREKLIKIGANIVRHVRYLTFQMPDVAVPWKLFQGILRRIARLRAASLAPEKGW
jgi:hypothetical protein